jgi:hypothetical protein
MVCPLGPNAKGACEPPQGNGNPPESFTRSAAENEVLSLHRTLTRIRPCLSGIWV